MSTKEIFDEIQKRMDENPKKLAGIKGVYRFDITGDDPGIYSVAVADGKGVVSEGADGAPNITLTIASQDFASLVSGKLDGAAALLTGKVKIKGDMGMALKLQSLIK